MEIKSDTRGVEIGPHQHEDAEGYISPSPAGSGPTHDPLGEFPTGPAVGEQLPEVVATSSDGKPVDLHSDRQGCPAVLVFTRSAVW